MRSPLFVFHLWQFLQPFTRHEGRFSYILESCSDRRVATRNEDRPGSCEVKHAKGTRKTMSNLQSERFNRVNNSMRTFIPHAWNGFCNGIDSGANIATVIPTVNLDGIEDLKNRYDDFSCPPEQKHQERMNRYAEGQKIFQKLHPTYWKYYEMTEEIPCPAQDE